MEKVMVHLKGRQKDAQGRTTKIQMSAEGEHYLKAGKHYVKYMDNSIDKDAPVSTMLKIAEDSLTIIRQGAVGGTQRFQKDVEHNSDYRTPYGIFELKLRTTKLDISYGDVAGEVDFCYDVIVNGDFSGHNKLSIVISKLK